MYHEYNRLFCSFVFCLSRLFRSRCSRFPLASRSRYSALVFYTFARRPRTKPLLLRKTWATWCVAYVMGRAIRRITQRRLRACHLTGASIFERRCQSTGCSFFSTARSKIFPFLYFQIEAGFGSKKTKDSKRCADLVYNATALDRKHVAVIFTNLRFVFSPGIKLGLS